MSRFNRPKLVPLVMSVGGFVAMMALGIWQVERLQWKENLIHTIEVASKQSPLMQLPRDEAEREAQHFYTVRLTGHYEPEHEFDIAARYYKSRLGYSVITPFRIDEGADAGKLVLVNRGWIPATEKDGAARDAGLEGTHTITARIRISNERNRFTPANQPERNIWFGRDVAEMAAHAKLTVEPITLDRIDTQDDAALPIPSDGTVNLRNDHLGYAITWFSIGLAILVISLLYHRKKPEPKA